ncbi:Contains similarity to gb/U45880 X-linked inhibitor of apotosis protein from Homo sapiens and contains PF/00097 Zinc finger C3HC4 (Ring finger) domain [Arabidopsis thaliana]|jgi:E3 ubiquitin-protein ligase MUL1|uniref:E3 ubiquitin-protein ligase SPL2 n=3 Tax=Arabidopsis TaxID=3701 RepID=SPL2P_ARATH|nr:E3 Ubiquitin ligase family protein [Arabidopsis thaliana]Q9SYH3.1 RecName: Full=E3 ubiquitin-protein ligase SPL2; AltName: Full=RING-type E3 ubiquitin transferase SPL2; AltName: Full=SP1-like protein 2 [Arabidopsis thaliana]KAG7657447.1 Zinc finger RING-type [Arabidopsis suecica]AAD25789.1 Contains similarity to gb/U45880 X-linked inhibitor of apotosis protein from Homo sapiens and contains PF/00097 Zinc finger C3HC4 (Ring finger) domain [Arabidopsis thaliana]AAL24183.1 At1g54150/F15I1_32 [A|eukprot:NP_564653.1 E3 Ubiquitin ligase family protein [Arabidopsis thaliana]
MSSPERALLNLLTDIALSFDGAILGLTLAVSAVGSALKYASTNAALKKIKDAPEVSISDLRSLLPASEDKSETNDNRKSNDQRIVVVRGVVKPKISGDEGYKNNNVLISPETGDKALIIQRTQTYVYSGWKRLFQSTGHRFMLERSLRKHGADFTRTVPFVIVGKDQQSNSSFVAVNMDGSRQPLPLTTVYNRLQPINSSFLQAFLYPDYPVGLLDIEKILPPGKDITAVGIYSFNNGVPEIKSCQDLPYFLSEMTKDKMIEDLMEQTNFIFLGSVILGIVSVGILSYAAVRTWNKWKQWNHQRELPQRPNDSVVDDEPEDADEIPDGELCVICVSRRRVPAFIPCGHVVCCRRCASTVERELNPKCPVCLQSIRGSMRVYYS